MVVFKQGRFSVIKDEGRFFLYSVNDALLKSGTFEDCIKCMESLEG